MKKYSKFNSMLWDELTEVHIKAKNFYSIHKLEKGEITLKDIELNEIGDVKGKSFLHLQCHLGLDTLSWAMLGANVTGVDFSRKSINFAKSLSVKLNLPAEFICCDVYELSKILQRKFDIIFTSYGVLIWLYDLKNWAINISRLLNKNGFFYLVEGHPYSMILQNNEDDERLMVNKSYFSSDKPNIGISEKDYVDSEYTIKNKSYTWDHTISDILNAFIQAKLKLEFFHEFCKSDIPYHNHMVKNDNEMWYFKDNIKNIPLMFSLKASK